MTEIRFLTADDYPPMNFLSDGRLTGFNVDIARAICEELQISCTIQARPFNALLESLQEKKGDAVIASISATRAAREKADFSAPYYQTPARFVAPLKSTVHDVSSSSLAGAVVGVVAGSPHEQYLTLFFPRASAKRYPTVAALEAALAASEVDAAFADGLTFAVWLGSTESRGCCAFVGGPYGESRFFGEGVGVAVNKDEGSLREAIDWALARIAAKGRYAEIYLRYFPISFY